MRRGRDRKPPSKVRASDDAGGTGWNARARDESRAMDFLNFGFWILDFDRRPRSEDSMARARAMTV
jgi:hypothetical protein